MVKNVYGAIEINPAPAGYHNEPIEYISWQKMQEISKRKRQFIFAERARFVTEKGFPFMELSYFHVRIAGKKYAITNAPFTKVLKKDFRKNLYEVVKQEKVFIKNLFLAISTMCS